MGGEDLNCWLNRSTLASNELYQVFLFLRYLKTGENKMDKSTLCIYTLGRFYVKRGQDIVTTGCKRAKKRWNLFQILFTYLDQGLTLNKLINYLDLNINSNPGEALKSLVYYLRKKLKENQRENQNYILNQGGIYLFNPESNYWLDAEEFEKTCKKAYYTIEKDPERAVELYKKAVNMYRGDYLQEAGAEAWVLPVRAHYRNVYLNSLINAGRLLNKMGEYKDIIEISEKGLKINPFEEHLHELIFKALLNLGYHGEARLRYEETEAFFAENNLEFSSKIKKISELLNKNRIKELPKKYVKNFSDLMNTPQSESPLICDSETFMDIYSLEKASADRNNSKIFLISFKISNTIETIQGIKAASRFEYVLISVLRKCDVICRWDDKNYFVLLTSIKENFNSDLLIERIFTEVNNLNLNKELKLETEIFLTSELI